MTQTNTWGIEQRLKNQKQSKRDPKTRQKTQSLKPSSQTNATKLLAMQLAETQIINQYGYRPLLKPTTIY